MTKIYQSELNEKICGEFQYDLLWLEINEAFQCHQCEAIKQTKSNENNFNVIIFKA